jgi:serine/threonine protein kinase
MGEVYRARDMKLNRDVAIKVLPDAVAGDADHLARFQREAQVLASLNHPNIAHIYGLEELDGRDGLNGPAQALVMELVEGPTLSERIEGQRAQGKGLAFDETLAIAKQIIDALEAAHEQGIVHRDLKPANIKLRPDGTVKVLDFGLAKALEPAAASGLDLTAAPTITTPAMTLAGMVLGTAAYMSPEQARGRVVDKRTDIWAFGCVLFEMLAGTRPFDGDDIAEALGAVIHKDVPWSKLPAATPATVRTVLERCLEKEPKQRIRESVTYGSHLPVDSGHKHCSHLQSRRRHRRGAA